MTAPPPDSTSTDTTETLHPKVLRSIDFGWSVLRQVTAAICGVEVGDLAKTVTLWKSKLRSWGYEPIICSVETKSGLDSLQFYLRDRTSVIVGPSGVGKSSLINALRSNHFGLLPAEVDGHFNSISGSKWLEDQRVGEVSVRSGRGKHTTRHVSLLPLSGGGYVADTPGFSLPSLLKVTKQSLPLCFPEIREILSGPSRCAFHNCLHIWEPGCIVKTDWERYPYYLQLFDEIRIREEFQLRTLGTKREGDVSEGRRRKWVFPTLVQSHTCEETEQIIRRREMKIVGLSPYWFDAAEGSAVLNTVNMKSMFLLTGPNGGGKSSLPRSICAAALLGVCGFMVPAESALI